MILLHLAYGIRECLLKRLLAGASEQRMGQERMKPESSVLVA